MKKTFPYIFLMLSIPHLYFSQTISDALTLSFPTSQNILSSSFNKLLNTSNYNGKFFYGLNSNLFNFVIKENFKSTVIQSNTNNVKDEQFLFLSGSYKFSRLFNFGTASKSSLYSGDKRLIINKAAYFNSVLFINIFPIKNIIVTPFAGPASNEQVGKKDNGFIYGIEGQINKLRFNDFHIVSSAKFQNEDIAPRKNMIRYFNLDLYSKLINIYKNKLTFRFSQLKKDFYLQADSIISATYNISNNIQSRNETRYNVEDNFSVPRSTSPFTFAIKGIIGKRSIDRDIRYKSLNEITPSTFDTRIEELKLNIESQVNYYSNFFNSNLKISLSQQEENHIAKPFEGANQIIFNRKKTIEEQKSNRSQIISLSATGIIRISAKNNILFSLFHRKFKYDTPSTENFDDRDELLSIARIQFNHTFNPFFNIFLTMDGSINHIAYIFAERSANNNQNRSIKFSGGSTYHGENVSSTNIAEVFANYTTYDFEKEISAQKSFAFRQVAFKDSSTIKIRNNLLFKVYGYIKLSEQGDFNWENFSGKPLRFLKEIYFEPKLSLPFRELLLELGLRFFSLSTYNYTRLNERVLQSNYTSIGPLAEIRYLLSQKLNINMHGYYEFISPENNASVRRANLSLSVNWNF